MEIEGHASVSEFFREVVEDALDRQGLQTSEPTECYLVGLLGEFAKGTITDQPLSVLMARASEPGERVRVLKEVGDTSLYITGFFAESLSRKLVDAEFYMGLGEAAYQELAQRLSASASVGEVYRELAAKFPHFVDVLADVRARVNVVGSDVVTLYEHWLATRAEWVERRLRAMGMLVSPGKGYLQ